MALELLMADYGDIVVDYDEEEEEEEESSLLAETGIIFFEENSALEEVLEEMTNKIAERKTISVDFAMQRELDYCNKIKEMKKELPGYDFEELSMPVQVKFLALNYCLSPPQSFRDTQGNSEILNLLGNIMQFMPVELAIQREFAFQKKIKGMQLQPRCDFVELSMPVQGEPSTWEIGRRFLIVFLTRKTSVSITFAEKIIKEEVRDEMNIAKVAKESLKGTSCLWNLQFKGSLHTRRRLRGCSCHLVMIWCSLSGNFQQSYQLLTRGHSILEPTEMNTIPTSDKFPCFKDQATSEKVMWKTMSVELALQREVEYQGKIKRLKLQAGNDFREAPQPTIQGTSSDLELRNMNRESCFQNGSSLQGVLWPQLHISHIGF
ncbi:hypothetical protein MKW92_010576 [Papaver armeniacum]|nr:hypothetical protein MKW92_010576 [Papaver armeniacum]